MSTFDTWSESALPMVRDALVALPAAGPQDTAPVFVSAHAAPFPVEALRITGRDRVRFLHAMLSNDVLALEPEGAGIRATLNNVQGRLVADVHLYQVEPDKKTGSLLALFEPGAAAAFVEMLDRYVIAEKVNFDPLPCAAVAVVGPGAGGAIEALGLSLPAAGAHQTTSGEAAGAEVRVIRRELGAPESYLLVTGPESAAALTEALGLPVLSAQTLEALRIEAPLPRAGGDLTSKNIVLEGGLKDRAVSFVKGCYIGQEVICRLDSIGTPSKLLVQMEADGAPPSPGTDLFANGKNVGHVTSSVHSARRGGAVFLGYVKKRSNDVGATVHLGSADGPEARIVAHV